MGGTPRGKDKPGPSFEDGRLRDETIEPRQDSTFERRELQALIKKAAQGAHRPPGRS